MSNNQTDLNMIDELCPSVRTRKDYLKAEYAQGMYNAHRELDKLRLSDKLLERIFISQRRKEIMAVHNAVDHAIDESSERLRTLTC